jgi:nucleotide-binding universal stress UspA family protein
MLRSLWRIAWMVAATLMVSGCTTAYRGQYGKSLKGGGTRTQGPGRLARVAFYGNGFTSASVIAQFAVFRAAEYAHAQGKPYFLLYPTLIAAAMDQPASSPAVGLVGGKAQATAYVLPIEEPAPGALETAALLAKLAEEEGKNPEPAGSANGRDRR